MKITKEQLKTELYDDLMHELYHCGVLCDMLVKHTDVEESVMKYVKQNINIIRDIIRDECLRDEVEHEDEPVE